jgi:hypothetical protein
MAWLCAVASVGGGGDSRVRTTGELTHPATTSHGSSAPQWARQLQQQAPASLLRCAPRQPLPLRRAPGPVPHLTRPRPGSAAAATGGPLQASSARSQSGRRSIRGACTGRRRCTSAWACGGPHARGAAARTSQAARHRLAACGSPMHARCARTRGMHAAGSMTGGEAGPPRSHLGAVAAGMQPALEHAVGKRAGVPAPARAILRGRGPRRPRDWRFQVARGALRPRRDAACTGAACSSLCSGLCRPPKHSSAVAANGSPACTPGMLCGIGASV